MSRFTFIRRSKDAHNTFWTSYVTLFPVIRCSNFGAVLLINEHWILSVVLGQKIYEVSWAMSKEHEALLWLRVCVTGWNL